MTTGQKVSGCSPFSGKKKPLDMCEMSSGKKIPGTVLLSHTLMCSTIAAEALNYRVREGNVCFCLAISTGKKYILKIKKMFE